LRRTFSVSWAGEYRADPLGPRPGKPPVIAAPGSEHATIKIRHLYARLGGLDTVVFGSGDLSQVHSDHEAVELDQVTRGIAILGGVLSVN